MRLVSRRMYQEEQVGKEIEVTFRGVTSMGQRRPFPPRFFSPYECCKCGKPSGSGKAGGAAVGERAVRAIAVRDTLDIASFSGHGNEATLDNQKAQACARARSFAKLLHLPTMTTHMGSGVNHN